MDKKRKILVVDDDESLLDTTSSFLEIFGFEPILAKDGEEAISLYKKFHPGLVFMDIKMPKKSGYDAFFEIQKEYPNAKIIFMTAHADYSKWNDAKKKHAVELIEKPYDPEYLKTLCTKFYSKNNHSN